MAQGYLTTHVLDTAKGKPAAGLRIELFHLDGEYELVFHAGDYLRASDQAGDDPLFLDQVPIRFGMSDADAHYHVPLLLSPYGYSTYRGS